MNLFRELDPRTTLVVWGFHCVLLASISRYDVSKTLLLGAFPVFAFLAMNLRIQPFLRRLRIVVPFILLMVLANVWFDPSPVALRGIGQMPSGLLTGVVLASKAAVSILSLYVLEQTIPLDRLCTGLRGLRVPDALVDQLLFLHRYGLVVAAEADTMRRARDLRSIGKQGRGLLETTRLLGTFFLRCHDRSRRIHRSMLARGFSGSLPLPPSSLLTVRDFAWGGTLVTIFLISRWYP
jgi:cobalt/nickel transport system permease protein